MQSYNYSQDKETVDWFTFLRVFHCDRVTVTNTYGSKETVDWFTFLRVFHRDRVKRYSEPDGRVPGPPVSARLYRVLCTSQHHGNTTYTTATRHTPRQHGIPTKMQSIPPHMVRMHRNKNTVTNINKATYLSSDYKLKTGEIIEEFISYTSMM